MTEMHYVIALQFEQRNGVQRLAWAHGTITPEPWQTRSDVFQKLFGQMTEAGGDLNPIPLFFSLEPNKLPEEG
jgi:hypothetical protein